MARTADTKKISQKSKNENPALGSDSKLKSGKKIVSGKMRLSSVILIGYRNMSMNGIRSFLTIGGVAVGIGIITLLISLGFGIQSMVIREVTKNNPSNIIDVTNKSLENFVVFDRDTIGRIKNIDGIDSIEVSASIGGKFINGESQTDVIINAISGNYLHLANTNISREIEEKIFSVPEAVVITPKLATLLGFEKPDDAVNSVINYNVIATEDMAIGRASESGDEKPENKDQQLVVVGVAKDRSNEDAVYAFVSLDEIRKRYDNLYGQSAKISVKSESYVESARLQIEQMGFSTESVIDTVADINSFFSIIRIVLVTFGVIIMSISAMGMLNTLSVSLLQRTKEVGILKALGAKRKDIFKMFIIEAFIISSIGGILGVLGGYACAKMINYIVNILAQKYGVAAADFVEIPSVFILSIALFVIALGALTGLFPAIRASKIHALEALRYE